MGSASRRSALLLQPGEKFLFVCHLSFQHEAGRIYGQHILNALGSASKRYPYNLTYGNDEDLNHFLVELDAYLSKPPSQILIEDFMLIERQLLMEELVFSRQTQLTRTKIQAHYTVAYWSDILDLNFTRVIAGMPVLTVMPGDGSYFVVKIIILNHKRLDKKYYLHLKLFCTISPK
jgi:hypothetical protein